MVVLNRTSRQRFSWLTLPGPVGNGCHGVKDNHDTCYLLVLLRTTMTTLPTGSVKDNHDNRYLLVLVGPTMTTITYWSCYGQP
jgi:hypothetical protein